MESADRVVVALDAWSFFNSRLSGEIEPEMADLASQQRPLTPEDRHVP
jgi:hypothetical protein